MTRVIGPTGSRRRRRFLWLPVLCTAAIALFFTAGAQAVHVGFFELGGVQAADILGDGVDSNGPDWADLFDASGNLKAGALAKYGGHTAAFIADASSAGGAKDPTTFSGFGTSNKNTDPISIADCTAPGNTYAQCTPWGWDAGNVPPKDDLTNVYAYEVINPADGHLLLYGGIEREDPSGDSHVDLEFFQNPVSASPKPSFTGVRQNNDVIVSMDFLRGGSLGSVTVRKWNGSDYILQGTAGGEGCYVSDQICAFNNGANIDGGPWPNFDNHGALITQLQANAFTEMGVDLTALIGASPCLSTFMGKTRSSGSFTSELKDFAGPHNFDVCAPSTTLSVNPTTKKIHSGDNVTLTFSETNTGNEALVSPMGITATGGCSPAFDSGDANGNGKLDPGETWIYKCTILNVTSGVTISAYAFGTGALSGKLITGQDPCPSGAVCDSNERAQTVITVIAPSTSLTQNAAASITFTYTEANTGNDPISSPTVTDSNCSPVSYSSGDGNSNGVLDVGETWTFTCTTSTTSGANLNKNYAGTASGTDSLGGAVGGASDPLENESVDVTITHNHHS